MYGEKAFDLLDTQITEEEDDGYDVDEEYRDSFFDILE
jgi:hypothetical protein